MAAKFEEYTTKQRKEMSRLGERATRYKIKIDQLNKQLAQPVLSFEENQKLRETLKMFKDLLRKASEEITYISNQRTIYNRHLKEAEKHLNAADELKKKWGF